MSTGSSEPARIVGVDVPLAARENAQALLDEVHNSPVGLALLVEACEALWLDEEAVVALRKLCESTPWRGEL